MGAAEMAMMQQMMAAGGGAFGGGEGGFPPLGMMPPGMMPGMPGGGKKDAGKKDKDKDKDKEDKDGKDGKEVDANEQVVAQLELTWSSFATDDLAGDSNKSKQTQDVAPSGWVRELSSRPTYSLLQDFVKTERYALTQYARRTLVSVLLRYPPSRPLKDGIFNDQSVLKHVLRTSLSLSIFPSCELIPDHYLDERRASFKRQLLRFFSQREATEKDGHATDVLLLDASQLLMRSVDDREKAAASSGGPKIKTHVAVVTANTNDRVAGKEVNVPEFHAMRLTFELDAMSARYSYQGQVKIYADAECNQLLGMANVTSMGGGQEVIVPRNTFWYQASSINYYPGMHQQITMTITMKDIEAGVEVTDAMALAGDVTTALEFTDLAMRAGKRIPKRLLLLLMQSLATVPSSEAAQKTCRMAIRLFNHWDLLDEKDLPGIVVAPPAGAEADSKVPVKSVDEQIKQWVQNLEDAHSALRTELLLNWNNGGIPGSHLQNLLELVLAGRKAVGDATDDAKDKDEPDEDREPIEKYVVDSFKNYRDGQELVSIISTNQRRLLTESTIASTVQPHSSNRELYVADVCIRQGGKWYWEITLKAQPQYIGIGWVTREYRVNSPYVNFGGDYEGQSWALCGPHTQYYHRNVDHHPASSGGQAVLPTWQQGMVIGVALDMDEREMRFYFDGKCSGVAFTGFEVNEGLFPALLLGPNCQMEINFGRDQFEHAPKIGGWKDVDESKAKEKEEKADSGKGKKKAKKGKAKGKGAKTATIPTDADKKDELVKYCGFEDTRIKGSSWLARYRHASDVTQMIYARSALPEAVVASALEREVSLAPTPMEFEVHKAEGTEGLSAGMSSTSAPENVLKDDASYFVSSKSMNCHMVFNAVGKDTDVLLQEVNVRTQQSVRGFYGMVFVSQKVPDLDSFSWCSSWRKEQYQNWVQKKKSSRQAFRSHEPVAFFDSPSSSVARVKLDPPRRGRYITIKISSSTAAARLLIERVQFACIHGAHPLASLIGTPLLDSKTQELKAELSKTAHAVTKDSQWSREMDECLVNLVQSLCSKLGVSPIALDAAMLSPGPDERMRFKLLEQAPVNTLRARFAILKYLNRLVTPLLHYVDIRLYEKEESVPKSDEKVDEKGFVWVPDALEDKRFDDKSLSYIVHQLKGLYFMSTKKSVFDALLSMGLASETRDPYGMGSRGSISARVQINRIRAARARENPAKDPDGLRSVFGQLFTQLRTKSYDTFKGRKGQQMFSVTFLGEGSVDVGGPYRECITAMCADLMSNASPLFIPCPNNKNGVGLNREKFIVNPGCRSSLYTAMYEFVGVMMGIALRTQVSLNLNLGGIIWKTLLGHKVDQDDLEAIDKLCIQALNELKKFGRDKFDTLLDERFTTQLSNGQEEELKKEGKSIRVAYETREEYITRCINARLHESDQQVRAIRKGLNAVVPAHMLSLFSPYDLELMVCGDPEINIELLRKHTVYRGVSPSSPLIKNLWKCLESFNTEERQMFLRFVWGRSRLPVAESDWNQQFTVHALRAGDDKLPIAHTCFFSLELPNYTSYEILRKKIVFAIFNCLAIDVDFNPNNSQLNAWIDTD